MAPISLPQGFRFHPTDEELVAYYLKRKVHCWKIELDIIPEVDLYKCEPWDLPEKSFLPGCDMEWYFYCSRDRKYPNGSKTNRATEAGYWKATAKDRKVISSHMHPIGMKKTLVFYTGRAPHGSRTDWVMHEYRLEEKECEASALLQQSYALCRVLKKNSPGRTIVVQYGAAVEKDLSSNKTMLLSLEEKPSPLSQGEEEDQPNSRENSSEIINNMNVDDRVSKRRLQSLSYDSASCNFPLLNKSSDYPKVGHDETSCLPLEVADFPRCLTHFEITMLSPYSMGDHLDSPVKEADILDKLYRDAQASQENNYISQFLSSDVADIDKMMISSFGRA